MCCNTSTSFWARKNPVLLLLLINTTIIYSKTLVTLIPGMFIGTHILFYLDWQTLLCQRQFPHPSPSHSTSHTVLQERRLAVKDITRFRLYFTYKLVLHSFIRFCMSSKTFPSPVLISTATVSLAEVIRFKQRKSPAPALKVFGDHKHL